MLNYLNPILQKVIGKHLGLIWNQEIIDIDVAEHLNKSFSVAMTFDIDSELGNLINFNDIIINNRWKSIQND